MVLIVLVGIYEAVAGFGKIGEAPFTTMFWGYIIIGLVLPLGLLAVNQNFLAGILIAIGTFAARELFVYGGNAEPMTNRFGMGPEAFSTYNVAELKNAIYTAPHAMEVMVIIACVGVGIAIFKLLDTLLDVSNQPH